MKERDKGQVSPEQYPKAENSQNAEPLNEDGRASPGLPASQLEQQPHSRGINKPELHPPKEGSSQKEQKKPRRRWTDSEEYRSALQEAFQEAMKKRKEKLEPEEEELFIRKIFGDPIDEQKSEEIRKRCQQDRERRAKQAAQYKLRQERKKRERGSAQVFPSHPKK